MNDFTKEELKLLIIAIDELCFSKFYTPENQKIYNKIKSMIDNYCGHEWQSNPVDFVLYCSKCGITKYSNKQSDIL